MGPRTMNLQPTIDRIAHALLLNKISPKITEVLEATLADLEKLEAGYRSLEVEVSELEKTVERLEDELLEAESELAGYEKKART